MKSYQFKALCIAPGERFNNKTEDLSSISQALRALCKTHAISDCEVELEIMFKLCRFPAVL